MNILTAPRETPALKVARGEWRWITPGRTTSTAPTGTTRRRTLTTRLVTRGTVRIINISHLQRGRDHRPGSGQSVSQSYLSLSPYLQSKISRKLLPKNSTISEPSDPLAIGKFSCASCGKGFPQAYRLRRHVREVHDKEKMYECDECEKKFFKTNSLTRHKISVHEKIRPFSCQNCQSKFKDKSALKYHTKKNVCQTK